MEKDRVEFYSKLMEKQEDFSFEYVEHQDMTRVSYSALEFFISLDLTQEQYESLMKIFESFASRAHPPYFKLQGWLQSCSPPDEFISECEWEVHVDLQALMQLTAERIVEMNAADIEEFVDNSELDTVDLTLFSTWSLDSETMDEGSSSWSFFGGNDILTVAVTPIQMIMNNDIDQTVWINAMPQSIRFCRPLKVEYICKDIEIIRETKLCFEQDIANLKRIRVSLPGGKPVHISFRFTLSLTEENAQEYIPEVSPHCLICGATPDSMNMMEILEADHQEHSPPYYSFTPLYVWVRFFEFLMEISFRSKLGQWTITDSTRDQYQQRKQSITQQIYEKFDDPVDPKRKSGEISQRAFANHAELSNLLGIDEELIVRFRNIAIAINVQDPINPYKLDIYCKETYRHYLNLYSWCRIPTAIHQVLAHGAEVCIHAPAPLAFLAEEATVPQKVFLNSRQTHHARERNHRTKLKDVFMRAMHGSDPIVSSGWVQRRRKHRYNQGYPEAVMDMLMYEDEGSDREEDDDDDDNPMKMLEYDVRLIDVEFYKFDD